MVHKIKMSEIYEYIGEEFKANSCRGEYTRKNHQAVYNIYSYNTLILKKVHGSDYPEYFDNTQYSSTTTKVQNACKEKYFKNITKPLQRKKYSLQEIVNELL